MSRLIKSALSVFAAGVVVLATSTAAHADTVGHNACDKIVESSTCEIHWENRNLTVTGGVVFSAYGEYVTLSDYYADGKGVYVKVSWGNVFWSYWLTTGDNTGYGHDLNIKDGTVVTIKGCQTDNGALINCYDETMKA
ncbi:MAG: hypothetical protein LBV60_25910 [Streptomyces sp.]|jgi:hypothetical protein|nr:hypothetical protein [Streptomyces sp.]